MESFLIILAELPGNFPKSCLGHLFCRVLANPKSVKEVSTADVVSRIIQKFKNMQGWRLQFLGLWFTKKDFHYRAPFLKFSKHPSDIWFRSSFSVALRTVDCTPATLIKREFFEISKRASFQNIPISVECSTKLQNAEIFPATLSKSDFKTDALPKTLKILGILDSKTFAVESGFSIFISGRLENSNRERGSLLDHSETFKTAVFADISCKNVWNWFLSTRVDSTSIKCLQYNLFTGKLPTTSIYQFKFTSYCFVNSEV